MIAKGPVLTVEQQLSLLKNVSSDEIKEALWSIPIEKSPGPDGFGSGFYQDTWSMIGGDVIQAVKYFFQNGTFSKELNSTHIILLSKTEHAHMAADYRPIACCGVVYK